MNDWPKATAAGQNKVSHFRNIFAEILTTNHHLKDRDQHVKEMDTSSNQLDGPPFRIAIVGCGPKGMYCLDSLLRRLKQSKCQRRVKVTILEPTEFCGAGNVYHPMQPDYLKMNFAAGNIDAHLPEQSSATFETLDRGQSIVEWLDANYPLLANTENYVPRRIVGEYLHDTFQQIVAAAPPLATIDVIRAIVDDISPVGRRWSVTQNNQTTEFDEVLITIGHGGWRRSGRIEADGKQKLIENVFPVADQLNNECIPDGSRVSVGGFSLTFIDCAISLCEGRGGHFTERDGQYIYFGVPNQPTVIAPFCRSGRPILCKPVRRSIASTEALESVWQRAREQIEMVFRRDRRPWEQIWTILCVASNAALSIANSNVSTAKPDTDAWYRRWLAQPTDALSVLNRMKHAYAIATGREPLDESWSLAEVWRHAYPALVDGISFGGLESDEWLKFERDACEMERVAFGPPACNYRKNIALIDAGVIDLGDLKHSPNTDREIIVDATIASPTAHQPDSLLGKLVQRGLVKADPVTKGLMTDKAAAAIEQNGQPLQGLAIVGRPTEGWILGNDTLSRTLHSQPENWANAVCQRIFENQTVGK